MLTSKFPLFICQQQQQQEHATERTSQAKQPLAAICLRQPHWRRANVAYTQYYFGCDLNLSQHTPKKWRNKQWKATSGIRFSRSSHRILFQKKNNNLLILFSIRLNATCCCCCCFCCCSHFWHLVWMELRFCQADNFGVYYRHFWWCYMPLSISLSLTRSGCLLS